MSGTEAEKLREWMVRDQIESRGIRDPLVLGAMRRVPRERFTPESQRKQAYVDAPLPIGYGQTISQPYVVAYMTEALGLDERSRVLEIGTGCGYQTAVLAEIAAEVFSIEIVAPLAREAAARLADLGYRNVRLREGDGYGGWREEAPFDAILVAAASDHVPDALTEQLTDGGRLIIPVGDDLQDLMRLVRHGDRVERERTLAVRFVPMTGQAQSKHT